MYSYETKQNMLNKWVSTQNNLDFNILWHFFSLHVFKNKISKWPMRFFYIIIITMQNVLL